MNAQSSTLRDRQEAAVIDVGSNSVRLVIYRVDGRAMTPVLNEKVMAGLGRELARSGSLAKPGADAALRALRRFQLLLEARGVESVFAVATAAVREASDGAAFAERIRAETGISLRILSGAEEAQMSALGVIAGVPEASGVVGDLGGASLELIEVGPKSPGRGETFQLGPLALAGDAGFDYERVNDIVGQALAKSAVLGKRGGSFYAVGGAWRALGRIDMAMRNHPLGVLHQYDMGRSEALKLTEVVRRQSRRSLEKLEEAAAKRSETLPYAAVVLERLMQIGQFERVVISAYGLREGVLLERMSAEALEAEPLIASAEALAGRVTRSRQFGRTLDRWIAPMFEGQPWVFQERRERILRAAAARLADIGGPLHPDQRSEIMFDLVLRAPLAAISHEERAFLAAAIHHRYTKSSLKHADAYTRLLNEERRAAAAALGAALRLGADLSGRNEALLGSFDIRAVGDKLVLKIERKVAELATETALRRFEAAAQALGLASETKVL